MKKGVLFLFILLLRTGVSAQSPVGISAGYAYLVGSGNRFLLSIDFPSQTRFIPFGSIHYSWLKIPTTTLTPEYVPHQYLGIGIGGQLILSQAKQTSLALVPSFDFNLLVGYDQELKKLALEHDKHYALTPLPIALNIAMRYNIMLIKKTLSASVSSGISFCPSVGNNHLSFISLGLLLTYFPS